MRELQAEGKGGVPFIYLRGVVGAINLARTMGGVNAARTGCINAKK